MSVRARFPELATGDGGYESFYLRAVDPRAGRGLWLRHTVHKRPGAGAVGSIWVTLFGAGNEPRAVKQSLPAPAAPPGSYIAIGDSVFTPAGVRGSAQAGGRRADYDLQIAEAGEPLQHLPRAWMYRAPLPRTKLESPHPAARFSGRVTVDGVTVELDRWPGMVGHNWGAEHAERWIWLHGTAFADVPDAWLDVALGRVRVGPFTTPWIANGVVSAQGRRHRMGGLGPSRRPEVVESPLRLLVDLPGAQARLRGTVESPRVQTVVWRYADPDGGEHHVANCSVAALDLVLEQHDGVALPLRSPHGGAYELGMRETGHELPVQPFADP